MLKTLTLSRLGMFCVLCLALSFAAHADDEGVDLRALMSAEEFNEAGLDKLSDEELARLGAWFRDNRDKAVTQTRAEVKAEVKAEVEAEVAAAAAAQPAAKPEKPPEEFTARARGFAGWAGKTVFALDNGQVWRQRMPGKFNYSGSANEVKFDKNFMGGWVMEHVESGRTVLVELID